MQCHRLLSGLQFNMAMKKMDPHPCDKSVVDSETTEYDDCNDKISIPSWFMQKVMTITSHDERIELVEEYLKKKADIVAARGVALMCEDDMYSETRKQIKSDIHRIEGMHTDFLWDIAMTRKHPLRAFCKMAWRERVFTLNMRKSLVAAGEKEALERKKMEKERIHREFWSAARELDEDYRVLMDVIQTAEMTLLRGMDEIR